MPTSVPRPILVVLAVLFAAACLVAVAMENSAAVLATKPLPALLLAVWVWTSASKTTRSVPWVHRLVVVALLFSMVGDIILELGKEYFVFGLGAFLVAHIAYLGAFLVPPSGRRPQLVVALPFAAWGIGMAIYVWPGLAAKGMEIPVVVYMLVLTSMMWRACARADEVPTRAQWAAMVGAIVFGLSDSLIALRDFHAPFEWSKYGILTTYWIGQLGLAFAFVDASADPSDDAPP